MSRREQDTTIEFEGDERLVLYDFLARHLDRGPGVDWGNVELRVEHEGEYHALMLAIRGLETDLVAPFCHDYMERVEEARDRIADRFNSLD